MNNQTNTTLASRIEIVTTLLLSLFFVVFLWGFFTEDVYALGINLTLYLGGLVLFFVNKLHKGLRYSSSDLAWITPLLLLALSFGLYENPFFKPFMILVFPVTLSLFYSYSWIDNKKDIDWNVFFITRIIMRLLSFFIYLRDLLLFTARSIFYQDNSRQAIIKRVALGIILLIIALLVIIPILSSADPLFAQKLKPIYDFVTNILSTTFIARTIVFTVLTFITLSALLAWGRPNRIESTHEERTLDLVVTNIVLGGIFIVYLFFLWVQLDRLWVGALPFDFKATENLVKSGFWQLLFLSFVNLAIFFALYRKTAPLGQKMLGVFSISSVLLLASSAHRMFLYVTYYGFSYEKFYASYAVLFCAILFIWLISRLFVSKKSNVVKFLAFQFLWMFALVSVFPVEQFILRSNMALVQKSDTKIKLYEMTMLSADVLNQIKKYKNEGKLKEEIEYTTEQDDVIIQAKKEFDWNPWIMRQEAGLQDKKWYEVSLTNLTN